MRSPSAVRAQGARARPEPIAPREAACLALIFLAPVFFYRGTQEIFEVPKVALLVTGALALAALALAAGFARLARGGAGALAASMAALRSLPRRDPLGCALLLYLGSCLVSTVTAPNPAQSFFGAPESTAGLRTALATAAVFFAVRSLHGTTERFDRIAALAAMGAVIAALYGGLQAIERDPLEWGRTASYGRALRVFGTLGHPNFLGASLAMSLPLMIHCRRRAGGAIARLAWAVAAMLSLAVLVATLSRAAWIGFAAAVLAWPLLETVARRGAAEPRPSAVAHPRGRPRWAIGVGIGLVMAGALAVAGILALRSPLGSALGARLHDLVNPRAATTQTRVHIWAAGLRMASRRPWSGVGLDAFGTVFPAYRTSAYWRLEWGATPVKAHNEAIEILATQGIFGATSALLVVAIVAWLVWRGLHARAGATRSAAAVAGAALVAFGVQDLASFTVVGIGVPAAALAAWLAAANQDESRPDRPETRSRRSIPAWAWAGAAFLALVGFVPLVANPWRAEAAARRAATMPERSAEQARALGEAERRAPWDSRYPAQIAFLWFRRAQDQPDSTLRRALLEDARAASERALRLEPQSGNYRTNLGEIEMEQALLRPPAATPDQAAAELHRALAADTTNGQTLDRIGFALARLGRKGEAREVALRLAALYPDLGPPLGLLGLMALDERRIDDGIDTLRLALGRDWRDQTAPHASAWSNLSVGYLSARRYAEARDAASRALRLDPGLQSARHNLRLAEGVLQTIGAGSAPAR